MSAPDAEFDVGDVMPDMSGGRVRADAERLHRSYAQMFDDYRIQLIEIVANDGHRVVTCVEDGGRIRGSDADVRNRFFHTFTLERGLITRWTSHLTAEQALAAAGMRGQPGARPA